MGVPSFQGFLLADGFPPRSTRKIEFWIVVNEKRLPHLRSALAFSTVRPSQSLNSGSRSPEMSNRSSIGQQVFSGKPSTCMHYEVTVLVGWLKT